jgi:hypothetical protein
MKDGIAKTLTGSQGFSFLTGKTTGMSFLKIGISIQFLLQNTYI